jgi:hypothetical protein
MIQKSYIRLYWRIWLGLVLCLLAVRFSIFVRVEGEDIPFTLFNCYAVPTWLAVMVLNMVEGRRLMNYLKQNHHHKWEYLTSGPGFGPGGVNSFRSLPFLYSDDDLGDAIVKELKTNYRRFVKLTLTVFFTIPALFIITMLPWGS